MIGKGRFVDGFIWNPSICKSECDKSCDIEEYLDYANCNCREKLIVNFGGVATNNGLGRVGGGGVAGSNRYLFSTVSTSVV